jgi:hypothetical protein
MAITGTKLESRLFIELVSLQQYFPRRINLQLERPRYQQKFIVMLCTEPKIKEWK